MIKGLYEAHLPVCNLERSIPFYESLGLKLYKKYKKIAFFWIVENESWLGLWEDDEYKIPYHPASRHIAFRIEMDDLEQAIEWLNQKELWQKKALTWNQLNRLFFQNKHMHLFIFKILMEIA